MTLIYYRLGDGTTTTNYFVAKKAKNFEVLFEEDNSDDAFSNLSEFTDRLNQ